MLLAKIISQMVLVKYEEGENDDQEKVKFRSLDRDVTGMIYSMLLIFIGWDHHLMYVHAPADSDTAKQ